MVVPAPQTRLPRGDAASRAWRAWESCQHHIVPPPHCTIVPLLCTSSGRCRFVCLRALVYHSMFSFVKCQSQPGFTWACPMILCDGNFNDIEQRASLKRTVSKTLSITLTRSNRQSLTCLPKKKKKVMTKINKSGLLDKVPRIVLFFPL